MSFTVKWLMRAACQAALGFGCMASAVAPASAAEWSIAPTFSWDADNDSDRSMAPQGVYSQSTALSATLQMERATETTQFSFSPQVDWQFYDTKAYGNVFERDLNAGATWSQELGNFSLSAQDADQSTLTTEATQTGILSTSVHRRTDGGSLGWSYGQTERRTLDLQASYTDTSYYGPQDAALLNILSGYRYLSSSIGERFGLSERTNLTTSVLIDRLLSNFPGGDETEAGAQMDFNQTVSERILLDVSGGVVKTYSAGGTGNTTITSLNLTRTYSLGQIALAFSRTLQPYGTGVLAQRQQLTLSGSRNLTEQLSATASIFQVRNSQPTASPASTAETQLYDTASVGLLWQFAETWKLSAEIDATRSRNSVLSGPVNEWRTTLYVIWSPRRISTSF